MDMRAPRAYSIPSSRLFGLGKGERTETLSTLLAMKQRLGEAAPSGKGGPADGTADGPARPAPQVVSSTKPRSTEGTEASTPSVTTAKPTTENKPAASGTTTSRLLEAKRRAQKKKP